MVITASAFIGRRIACYTDCIHDRFSQYTVYFLFYRALTVLWHCFDHFLNVTLVQLLCFSLPNDDHPLYQLGTYIILKIYGIFYSLDEYETEILNNFPIKDFLFFL